FQEAFGKKYFHDADLINLFRDALNVLNQRVGTGGGGTNSLAPFEVRVLKKAPGNNGGFTKEPGDWVYGEPYENVYWALAIVGSDPEDYNTYTVRTEF